MTIERTCIECAAEFVSDQPHRKCGPCRWKRHTNRERMPEAEVAAIRARVVARMAERGVDIHGRPLDRQQRQRLVHSAEVRAIVDEAGITDWRTHRPEVVTRRFALFRRLSDLGLSPAEIADATGARGATVVRFLSRRRGEVTP